METKDIIKFMKTVCPICKDSIQFPFTEKAAKQHLEFGSHLVLGVSYTPGPKLESERRVHLDMIKKLQALKSNNEKA